MKILFLLPFLLLGFTACSGSKNSTPETESKTTQEKSIAEISTDTSSVDALSSPTSKPNEVLFNGTLVLPPEGQATVTAVIGGTVKESHLLSGMMVKKNQILVKLENPEFIKLQQTYLESFARLEYLEAEYNRQQALLGEQVASQKSFQESKANYLSMKSQVQATAAQLELLGIHADQLSSTGIRPYLEIKSPLNGYLGNILINTGKHLAMGEAICHVFNKQRCLLKLVTYEKDLPQIHQGERVEFKVNGLGTSTFKATIISIGQQVDEVSRAVELYARVDTSSPLFRPGMYVTARIIHIH